MIICFILVLAAVSGLLDWALYRRIARNFPRTPRLKRVYLWGCVLLDLAIVCALLLYRGFSGTASPAYMQTIMWIVCIFMTCIAVKAVYMLVSLLDYPARWILRRPVTLFARIGTAAAAATLACLLWSASGGRNLIRTERITIESDRLPAAFDGYRIVLISDLHIGTRREKSPFIDRLVERINGLDADMVICAGDLVNRDSEELTETIMRKLSRIESRDGVYSVEGNHDLGFYMERRGDFTPERSVRELNEKQRLMGWTLLNNESRHIVRGGDSIAVSGVKYPSDGFHNGHDTGLGGCDPEKAYETVSPSTFDVTISHTPRNWDEIRSYGRADLTVSGHVHSMQFKIPVGERGWSPARWMYDHWSGLYREGEQYLYVNDGIGYVMYPMRIGTRPEITVFTLESTKTD